ncbi:MAG: hypothetical protein AB1468_01820 [Candidatus Micrarchaeota archaeon]
MELNQIVFQIADFLKEFDSTMPVHKNFKPGIGPFGEPQIVKEIARGLSSKGIESRTHRTPDMLIKNEWAVEFKIARPYGDNGTEAENWSVNLLHPYPGNISLLGDCCKLQTSGYSKKAVIVVGYEHNPAKIKLESLIRSFEVIASQVMGIHLSNRVEEIRTGLVHPVHQVVLVVGWEVLP